MFAPQIFQDLKENVKSNVPTKTSTSTSRKALKSYNLNNYNDSGAVLKNKKDISKTKSCSTNRKNSEEKAVSKLKLQSEETKENQWPDDIEAMPICNEPDDDYGDIMPLCDRIQKEDIDSLFLTFTYSCHTEPIPDKRPSPLKDFEMDFEFPELTLPKLSAPLFDDSELHFIPPPPWDLLE